MHPLNQESIRPLLADIIDIKQWLAADASRPYVERLERDSGIAADIESSDDAGTVRQWWQRVSESASGADAAQSLGDQVEHARGLTNAILIAVGTLLGVSVTTTALTYTGDAPVNLLTLLTVLVLVPGLLLLLGALAALPIGANSAIRRSLSGMNPGYWLSGWLEKRTGFQIQPASRPAWLRCSRWQLVVSSQAMAIAYFLAALATLLALVTLSDLAFGWSTTLNVDTDDLHAVFNALALPWSGWLSSATPDAALVSESRFFRLDGAVSASATRLGQWWPFVAMTVLTYGLLPRVVLLLVALWRRRVSYRRLLLDDTDVTALLDRLCTPVMSRDSEPVRQGAEPATQIPAPNPSAGEALVLVWNNAATGKALTDWLGALAIEASAVIDTGSTQALPTLTGEPPRRVVWVTKGWEPPLLEFVDAVAELRQQLPADTPIAVAPLPLSGHGIDPNDQRIWAGALARAADAKLFVMGGAA